jgi:hormone-sensitive lipase
MTNYETIMIHIHGGGFVSLSSFSMQNHTRRWANDLSIPVFSIDYRLSPQSVFPDAL